MNRNSLVHAARFSFAAMLLLAAVSSRAIVVKEKSPLDSKVKLHTPFIDKGGSVPVAQLGAALSNQSDWLKFQADNGPQDVWLDPQTGRIRSVSGRIPWIPGMFNTLTKKDIAGFMTSPVAEPGIAELDRIAQDFITRNAKLFRIPAGVTYVLNAGASNQGAPNANMWNLRYDLFFNGVPISGGALIFVVKHGNLILWGTEGLDDAGQPLAAPAIRGEQALSLAAAYMGGRDDARDTTVGEPRLIVLPERTKSAHGYRQVWEVRVARGDEGTYLSRVDAATGEIIEFRDVNEYAQIKGGIFPTGPLSPEVTRPLGFADFNTGVFADAGGSFTYPGGTVTSSLTGQYVRINDTCGAIAKSVAAAPGDIDFGTSAGTDCTIPAGGGGAGNTHSARSCYYHTDLIKQKGRYYFPVGSTGNTWLSGVLQANVNIVATCNANWNGSQVNFFRSGGGCGNTGEIAGVFLHEWGHGMDQNDGNGSGGSGEAMGDTVAMLQQRDSCIGPGFRATNCAGYGNACSSCTGVRDQDRAKHAANKIITPATIAADCTSTGGDPCGREVHCEGQLPANTVWDLAFRDIPARPDVPTANDAWTLADKMWWVSGQTRNAAYTCANTTGPPWNNGCGVSSWYKTFLAADDDDGDLSNGTPHASTVFAAFNRHGISCGVAADAANTDHNGCAVAIGGVGTLSATPGSNVAYLTWSQASNASSYTISRNNLGCSFGFTPITTVSPGNTTLYADTSASNGNTWYYNIQALGSNSLCTGPISNCVSVTPAACAGSTPSSPVIGTATVPGTNQVNVSWSQGAPTAATKFNLYRATGTCAAPGSYGVLKLGLAAAPTNNTDATVNGGITYAYKVTGTDAGGSCESGLSGCAQALATGTCAIAPTFAGLTTVTNAAQASCSTTLNWSAASKNCPTASNTLTYTVYRSTNAGFVPSALNQIATGLTTTTYSDSGSLVDSTAYYYNVRASDSFGNLDNNVIIRSASPTGPFGAPGTWADDAGDTGTAKMTLNAPWSVAAAGGSAGPKVYQTGTYAANTCASLVTPSLLLGTGSVLSFRSHYNTELNYDKGIVQLSTDGGNSWTKVTTINYPVNATQTGDACGFGAGMSFSGNGAAYASYTGSLSTWNNTNVKIRWSLSSDVSVQGTGWWVDDVTLTNASSASTCSTACSSTPFSTNALGSKSGTNLVLNWGAVGGAVTYKVYREPTTNPATWVAPPIATGLAVLTYNDANQLGNTTSQFYSMTDVNGCGAESPK